MNKWPLLKYDNCKETLETLHLWMQIVGKLKLEQNPFLNHWWEIAFSVTPRGMTTGNIPYKQKIFDISFDFVEHKLIISLNTGEQKILKLKPQTVKDFYKEFTQSLAELGIRIKINTTPSEITNPIPFPKDTIHKKYDKKTVTTWWQLQLEISLILDQFRMNFRGKSSPVLFYWGSFDLNTTRFSGKKLPDKVDWPKRYSFMRYAENEENFAAGFWPGDERFPYPAFYSYIYPAPKGCESINTGPEFSYFNNKLSECIFPYEEVRKAKNPEKEILQFYETTYREFAKLAKWDINELKTVVPPKYK